MEYCREKEQQYTIAKGILKFGGRRWRKKDLENYLTKGNRILEGIEGEAWSEARIFLR